MTSWRLTVHFALFFSSSLTGMVCTLPGIISWPIGSLVIALCRNNHAPMAKPATLPPSAAAGACHFLGAPRMIFA